MSRADLPDWKNFFIDLKPAMRFHRSMNKVDSAQPPLRWGYVFLENFIAALLNRIAIDVFTIYCKFQNDDIWIRICAFDAVIRELETNKESISENAKSEMSRLIPNIQLVEEKIECTRKDLIAALKAHRYSLRLLLNVPDSTLQQRISYFLSQH